MPRKGDGDMWKLRTVGNSCKLKYMISFQFLAYNLLNFISRYLEFAVYF